MSKKLILPLIALAVLLVGGYLLFGPGAALTPSPAPTPVGVPSASKPATSLDGGLVQVAIRGFAFVGASTKVVPGTTVTWKNFDNVNHSVVGAGFQSKVLKPGESFSYKFTKEGTYPYYCGIHPDMKGEVIVRQSNF